MTTTIGTNGRLGNQIIRNLAVSLLAKKHNLQVDYYNYDLIKTLGIDLFIGKNTHRDMKELTDDNYFSIYNCDSIDYNLNPNNNFFQTRTIIRMLHRYIHSKRVKSAIITKNPFKERYNANRDAFIHIRLDDASQYTPGIYYYLYTLEHIMFDKLYISTDEEDHDIVKTIMLNYPSAILVSQDEIKTFQFASTCRNIILSHGSFSAIIGYLSFFSNIYYPAYEADKIWYGDMFSIDTWIKCSIK
jgi:hypothetical protein